MTSTRRVSIVAPMLDEAAHVEGFVADVAAQDYDGEVELLVADGGSTDGSRGLLESAAVRAGVELTVVDNPRRIVAPGLNECIRRASGDLIVRLDCHSRYPADYLSGCVRAADETGAWNVGGVYSPQGTTRTERAVACALDSAFGGVNWTRDAAGGERVDADTVYLGAFRPVAFERAGLYDESLVRNQDDELNLRIRRAGGRIVLDPSIRATYRPRGTYRSLARQYHEYGLWKVAVMARHRQVLSARSLAPVALVSSLALLGAAAPLWPPAAFALGAELAVYGAAATTFAVGAVRRRGEPLTLLPRVLAAYPTLHLAYGLGMARGAARLRKRRGARPLAAGDAASGRPSPG